MRFGLIWNYYIVINIIGFICGCISSILYSETEDKDIDLIMTIIATIGGSLGIVLELLIFDRKLEKIVMLSRVYALCMSVIQLILCLYLNGYHAEIIRYNVIYFFEEHKVLIIYFVVVNVMAIILYGLDKIRAVENVNRIKIITLLGIALIGGSIGALIGMYSFRHKTKQIYFVLGVPLILVMQIVVIFYCMNLG